MSQTLLRSSVVLKNRPTTFKPLPPEHPLNSPPLGKAIWDWLFQYKQHSVRTSTFDRLLVSYKLMSYYPIALVPVCVLCTKDVQKYVNSLNASGYGVSTIKKQFNLVSAYLNFALGEGLPVRPACENVTLPIPENTNKPKRDVVAYTEDERLKLEQAIEGQNDYGSRSVTILLETGMRVGELLSLYWSDIQWNRKAVHIHRTLVRGEGRKKAFVQEGAKSRSSNRTIPLSSKAFAVLKEMYAMDKDHEGLIFHAENGSVTFGYNALRNALRAVCEKAGVPYRGFHVFRHTFATRCYHRGCEVKLLSKLLGHSSVTITYNTYIHLYGDALEELRGVIE